MEAFFVFLNLSKLKIKIWLTAFYFMGEVNVLINGYTINSDSSLDILFFIVCR